MGQAVVLYDFNGNEITYSYPLNTVNKYRSDPHINLYVYRLDAEPTLTSDMTVGDTVLAVDSNTNVTNGDAITLYEDDRIFQSIVVSSTTTSITIGSKVDYAFTTSATVEVGPWNAAVNGSSSDQEFKIKSPPNGTLLVNSVSGTILDEDPMDDAKFGGLSALTNGITYRIEDGEIRQLALIVNNTGFFEYGFNIEYSDKAPAGSYGLRLRRDLVGISGSVLELSGTREFELIVRDDLTGLTQFTTIVNGRITS